HVCVLPVCVCLCIAPASSEVSPLSLHDALPIYALGVVEPVHAEDDPVRVTEVASQLLGAPDHGGIAAEHLHLVHIDRDREAAGRSEEHTSELQSRENLVCRLLLEKKKEKDGQRG